MTGLTVGALPYLSLYLENPVMLRFNRGTTTDFVVKNVVSMKCDMEKPGIYAVIGAFCERLSLRKSSVAFTNTPPSAKLCGVFRFYLLTSPPVLRFLAFYKLLTAVVICFERPRLEWLMRWRQAQCRRRHTPRICRRQVSAGAFCPAGSGWAAARSGATGFSWGVPLHYFFSCAQCHE